MGLWGEAAADVCAPLRREVSMGQGSFWMGERIDGERFALLGVQLLAVQEIEPVLGH